jgi:hypothetical protein
MSNVTRRQVSVADAVADWNEGGVEPWTRSDVSVSDSARLFAAWTKAQFGNRAAFDEVMEEVFGS